MSVKDSKQNGLFVARHIGEKIKERRMDLNLSQTDLAKRLGFTPQQMHKYEKGTNRISTDTLLELSKILSVPPKFFYQGLEGFSALHSREIVVVCKNEEGNKFSLRLLDDEYIFSEIKVVEKKL